MQSRLDAKPGVVKVYHSGHYRRADLLHVYNDGSVLARLRDKSRAIITVAHFYVRGQDLAKLARFASKAVSA